MHAENFKLSNGLDVVYMQLPGSQNYRLILDVPIGAMHDPIGKEGLSHILEHTVFCGAEHTSEQELMSQIRAVGGDYNAFTSKDKTAYEISASSQMPENFFRISDILRQFITEPTFEEERVRIEKRIIVNELRDGMDNLTRMPSVMLDKAMHKGATRWANNIGTEESISAVSCDNLKEFIKENYDAGHMTLYAAGPMEPDDAREALEQTLSAIPNLNQEQKPRYEMKNVPTDIRKDRAELMQNYTIFMFSFDNGRNPFEKFVQFEASHQISKLLNETLRRKYGCFYTPEFGGWDGNKETFMCRLMMSTSPGEDSIKACEGILEFYNDIDSIMTDEIVQATIDRTKFFLSRPDHIESDFLSRIKVDYEDYGELFSLGKMMDIVNTVTPEDVRKKAKEILSGIMGMYVQGPEPHVLPSLEFMRDAMRPVREMEQVFNHQAAVPTNDKI